MALHVCLHYLLHAYLEFPDSWDSHSLADFTGVRVRSTTDSDVASDASDESLSLQIVGIKHIASKM